jgi:flagellar assembly protein FliH
MAAPAKFLFDMDFAAPDKTRAPAITPAEIAEKVANAEAQAYRAGFDAAQREAKAESDRRAALALEQIAVEPLTEVMALVHDCFKNLVSTPHLVVRINDQLYDEARERIEKQAKQSGFAGRLVILAEPDIENGDCKIEWADGGVVLERATIDAKINELVGRYMASRNQA